MPAAADITKVEAPVVAVSGEAVIVDVHVKNLGLAPGGYNDIAVTGRYDSSILSWQFSYLNIAPQETVIFRGNFIMPLQSVTVIVWSHYWDGSKWVLDDSDSVNVSIPQPEPEPTPAHLFNDLNVFYSLA